MSSTIDMDIEIKTGTTFKGRFVVTDQFGVARSLVGAKVWFALKSDPDDVDGNALLLWDSTTNAANFDFTNGINGVYDLTIPVATTGTLTTALGEAFWFHKVMLSDGTYGEPTRGRAFIVRGGIQAI